MASMTAEVDEIEGDQAEDTTTDLERERQEDEERYAQLGLPHAAGRDDDELGRAGGGWLSC